MKALFTIIFLVAFTVISNAQVKTTTVKRTPKPKNHQFQEVSGIGMEVTSRKPAGHIKKSRTAKRKTKRTHSSRQRKRVVRR